MIVRTTTRLFCFAVPLIGCLEPAPKPYLGDKVPGKSTQPSFGEEKIEISPDEPAGGAESQPEVAGAPLPHKPTHDPYTPPRNFGSSRDGGARLHAAYDLYSHVGRDVLAVAEGKVLDTYYFYSGTHAIEVLHEDLNGKKKIVRYGEVSSSIPVSAGDVVTKGQVIGKVGKMNCCRPMLHLEMYSGTAKGPLTDSKNPPYRRRSDIEDGDEFIKHFYSLMGWSLQY